MSIERAVVDRVNVPSPSRSRRILIVDDEDDIREIASITLEITEGWRVAVASSVADALQAAQLEPPDAILLDVMMPDVDGPSGLLVLRSNPTTNPIPVIFLTAKAGERDLCKLLDLGVQGVIAKPFDPMTLGRQVRELLRWE